MKKVFMPFVLAALAIGSVALAQDNAEIVLSSDACRNLAVYQPGVDGDAAYKPGVDVTGKPVVEADLGGGGIPAPDTVEFDLTVDMAQYLGFSVNPAVEGKIGIAKITVLPDGRILRDGQPLEGQAEAALRALCKDSKTQKNTPKPDFQKQADPAYNQR